MYHFSPIKKLAPDKIRHDPFDVLGLALCVKNIEQLNKESIMPKSTITNWNALDKSNDGKCNIQGQTGIKYPSGDY